VLTVLHGHCITELRKLPAASVHCTVTSPPYWGLRDYKTPAVDWEETTFAPMPGLPAITIPAWTGHLGLEPDPMAFVAHIVAVFREVKRVQRPDGTLWLNFGDCYAANHGSGSVSPGHKQSSNTGSLIDEIRTPKQSGLKEKDLVGMPWRIAFALQADGWYLRTDIIWHKPTVMPESVTDRPTKAHEYLFLLTQSPQYFYDAEAIKEEASRQTNARGPKSDTGVGFGRGFDEVQKPRVKTKVAGVGPKAEESVFGSKQNASFSAAVADAVDFRNKRTVWTIRSEPYSEAHFATFPKALVHPCILAGTSAHGCCSACGAPWERSKVKVQEGTRQRVDRGHPSNKPMASNGAHWKAVGYKQTGWQPTCTCFSSGSQLSTIDSQPVVVPAVVLDPFLGSGTTAQVALELGRHAVGIELGEHHLPLIAKRTDTTPGLALA
jgi:DNA modification methylase